MLKDSIAGTVIALRTVHPRIRGSMPGMDKIFYFYFRMVHVLYRLWNPPSHCIQCVTRVLPRG
jgi:hypothetical protein